jgi:hypothetical protein
MATGEEKTTMNPATARATARYIARARYLAEHQTLTEIERFYVFLYDEELYALEQEHTIDYDALCALYREWLGAMAPDERARLYRVNDDENSANQNHLLYELLAEDGTIR